MLVGSDGAGRWRVLIADDEPAARRGVRQLLAAYPDFTVVGECRDGREVLQALASNVALPDVVFLDVQMPELDGFEVIRRRTPERMPATVFLTAFDQFAIKAFEAEALDYLVKPVTEARFAATMKRLIRRLQSNVPADPALVVTTSRGALVLNLRDIDWIEAADYYARVWVGARSYLLRESLDDLERRVVPHGFARAHRKALVRISGVRALQKHSGGELVAVLGNGASVSISRRRRAAFAAAIRTTRNA
ncbi:MAG TPA: LytTR family DNA-binding domain-containing protein [Gemmatimonadaceae bacterium]|jgi:two-component system LytT family response regulator|nr:LytTR family DNA-binding domain-containing protein [Gemmatimonadaceae bacterium]